ncbi:glycosyltransferase family 4 protein [Xanthomonas translucens pv. graminis]|nr:glycosyltransferase family 4 protein [Xanthomonas translucens pv. graminis]
MALTTCRLVMLTLPRCAGRQCSIRENCSGVISMPDSLLDQAISVNRPYNAMSMLAFPSLAPETFGRISVEAQASEVPVLASRVGGVAETLDADVSGELLPPGDVRAWCDAILRLCDAQRRQQMGQAGRQFVQRHFAGAVIAAQFVQLLEAPRRAPQRLTQTQSGAQ